MENLGNLLIRHVFLVVHFVEAFRCSCHFVNTSSLLCHIDLRPGRLLHSPFEIFGVAVVVRKVE
jgi:hypothetical protein